MCVCKYVCVLNTSLLKNDIKKEGINKLSLYLSKEIQTQTPDNRPKL